MMPKRYGDTEIWKKPWFRKLPFHLKLFWFWLWQSCDCIGLWDGDFELASFQIGHEVKAEEVKQFDDPEEGPRILKLSEKRWWLPGFCQFQYGMLSRNPKNLPHANYIRQLNKAGLLDRVNVEPEQGELLSKPKPPDKARPSNVEEVARYMLELRPDLSKKVVWDQANSYWDRQVSLDWKVSVGKKLTPIVDWKATVRTWMRNAVKYGHIPEQTRAKCPGCGETFASVDLYKQHASDCTKLKRLAKEKGEKP